MGKRPRKFSESDEEGSKTKHKFFEDLETAVKKTVKKNGTVDNISLVDKKDAVISESDEEKEPSLNGKKMVLTKEEEMLLGKPERQKKVKAM